MEFLTPKDFEDTNPLSTTSRRVFIKGLGFVSVSLLVSTMGGCDQLADAIKNRPVRRRLRTGSAEVDADINTYRNAVQTMKGKAANDPLSWVAQATIHGDANHFNFCEHGTDHFFDWHRAYLFFFEKIIQKISGNPKFGLPYWNWNQDPVIHPAFLVNGDPLFMARSNTDMTNVWAISTAALDPIMQDTNFFTFMSQIESTPHNTIHCAVGLTMCSTASARDPLFWMHHCMIDYCWAKWNIELNNNNTNDGTWVGHVNSHFVDADGNPAEQTGGITTIEPLLSYRYESSAIGSSPAAAGLTRKTAAQKVEQRVGRAANLRFEVKQPVRLAGKAAARSRSASARARKLRPAASAAA